MLRKLVILTGFVVALDPYLGFPESVDRIILTTLGLGLVFLTALTRPRTRRSDVASDLRVSDEQPKTLHVERTEVEDTPQVHIERTTTVDKQFVHDASGADTEVETKKTVVRRRKRKQVGDTVALAPHSSNEEVS